MTTAIVMLNALTVSPAAWMRSWFQLWWETPVVVDISWHTAASHAPCSCGLPAVWARFRRNNKLTRCLNPSFYLALLTNRSTASRRPCRIRDQIWQTVTSLLLNGVILLKRPRLKQRERIWLKYVCVGRLMSARFKCESCCPIRATFLFISAETLHDGFFCWTLSKCCVCLQCRGVVTVQLPQRGTS